MKAAGIRRPAGKGKLIALAIIVLGVAVAIYVQQRTTRYPSTDDATVDADVIHVAAVVGGRITEIAVKENSLVAKGDLLFQIDPMPLRLTVAQAEAELRLAQAALDTQRRGLIAQRSNASVSGEQTRRAAKNLELAGRTVERLRPLAAQGYVPTQQFDQAQTAQSDAAVSLTQARELHSAANSVVGNEDSALAGVHAREAALALARRALEDATVRAPRAGRVVGLAVLPGEVVAPSQALFTLIDTEEWLAVANFRETELRTIAPGDCATVYSMIDRGRAIKGTVVSLGAGVIDTGRVNLPRSAPYVERSLNWVRVAQRFPVRVRLEEPAPDLVRLGASANVEIRHGAACR